MWNSKISKPIARKTIYLKQKLGGLNLIEPEAHNYAMRIKHFKTKSQPSTLEKFSDLLADNRDP